MTTLDKAPQVCFLISFFNNLILGKDKGESIVKIAGTIIQHLDIILGRFYFNLVEDGGIYSVYHWLDGSYGQKNFGTNRGQAEQHLNSQRMCTNYYKELIAKRDKLISRIAPISNKLDRIHRQINVGILT